MNVRSAVVRPPDALLTAVAATLAILIAELDRPGRALAADSFSACFQGDRLSAISNRRVTRGPPSAWALRAIALPSTALVREVTCPGPAYGLTPSHDGAVLAALTTDPARVHVWNLARGTYGSLDVGSKARVGALSPDGGVIVVPTEAGLELITVQASSEPIARAASVAAWPSPRGVSFDPQGRYLAVRDAKGMSVCEFAQNPPSLRERTRIKGAADAGPWFSPCGTKVVTAERYALLVWDLPTLLGEP